LSPDEGAALVAKVADALGAAHSRSIVHADVKPSNILLDGNGEPLLSDFGLSRWMAGTSPWDDAVVGTAEYLDPAVGPGVLPSAASDLYSLGIVCYEVMTARLPYRGATPHATLRSADQGRAIPLKQAIPAISVGLADVVERAMSRRPQSRPSSAGEFADALRSHIQRPEGFHWTPTQVVPSESGPTEDIGAAAGPRTLRPRRQPADHRRDWLWPTRHSRVPMGSASAAIVAMLLVFAGWAFGHHRGGHHSGDACRATPGPSDAGPSTTALTVLADIGGNGCRVPVTWSSGVVTVSLEQGRPPDRFALGTASDQLLLGDWRCGRSATPALYRPSTGQVFYFGAWAEPGHDVAPNVSESTAIVDGVPRVVHDGVRGCDRVEVDRPGVPPQYAAKAWQPSG
jgi:serine/threonine-protein kinase